MQTEQERTTFLLPWAAPTALTAKTMTKVMTAATVSLFPEALCTY